MHSHHSDSLDELILVRQRFMSLNPSIGKYCHSFDAACDLFKDNKLSSDQVSRFSRPQFDALYEGLSPAEVDMPGFGYAHLTAVRLGLPKHEYLNARFTLFHTEAIQRKFRWR